VGGGGGGGGVGVCVGVGGCGFGLGDVGFGGGCVGGVVEVVAGMVLFVGPVRGGKGISKSQNSPYIYSKMSLLISKERSPFLSVQVASSI